MKENPLGVVLKAEDEVVKKHFFIVFIVFMSIVYIQELTLKLSLE